ncbi:TrmH RNA methyltransferase [Dokdonella fugitiva]|nr:TrmH family RNA methyltransferase [Dokdonella fugitiva]MBA8882354.1 TrmH RNA methyltransferase [Dokdonella fugitiva]
MAKDPRNDSPWAGAKPRTERVSKREREALAARAPGPRPREDRDGGRRDVRRDMPPPARDPRRAAAAPASPEAARDPASREQRLYGLNACLAAFARRPEALRKVYLSEARIGALRTVLAWCVQRRIGYRVVETGDLDRLAASRHHEGVCFDLLRPEPLALAALLDAQPPAPQASLLLWLDGVGNPHNLGALLRSAAHFGAGGVIVPAQAGLDVSGAAARVAEGAAEVVPLVQADDAQHALRELHARGYVLAATVPRDGSPLYATTLPRRLVLVLGAEGEGMSEAMIGSADLRLTIPGSGAIESLNVAASVAVLLGEYWRQAHA